MRRTVLALAVASAAITACTSIFVRGPAPYRAAPTPPTAAPLAGSTLYQRDCAWCHGSQGEGTGFGPDLNGELDGEAYTDFMLRTGRMPLARPDTRPEHSSPHYTDPEIDAIVAYVAAFGGTGPARPYPDPGAGSLSTGEELYQENCAACHSTTGAGGALSGGISAPRLTGRLAAGEVAEAVLVGPGCGPDDPRCGPGSGAMPRFDLSKADLDSLVRYVLSLQTPTDPGGASLWQIGPVAEGAVGLLLGLGLLLVVVRWIGTRRSEES